MAVAGGGWRVAVAVAGGGGGGDGRVTSDAPAHVLLKTAQPSHPDMEVSALVATY